MLGFQCSYLPQLYKPQTHPQLYKPPLSSFNTFSIDQVNNFFFKKSFPELLTVSHRPECSRRPLLSSWVFLSLLSCVDLCPGSCDILLLEMFPPIFWWNTFLCRFLNRPAWKVISFAISNVPKVFILPFHLIDDFCKYRTLSWNRFLSEFGKHFSLSSSFQCCKVWCQLDSWIFTGNLEFFSFGTVLNSFFNNFFTSIFILLSSWVLSYPDVETSGRALIFLSFLSIFHTLSFPLLSESFVRIYLPIILLRFPFLLLHFLFLRALILICECSFLFFFW